MANPLRRDPAPRQSSELGLICGGGLADSWLLRFPKLAASVGPVRGPSQTAATRAVRTLRAGRAVTSLDEFRTVKVLLVAVSDHLLQPVLEELAEAGLGWERMTLLVASLQMDVTELRLFSEKGARVATIGPVEGDNPAWFAVQGDAAARRLVSRLLSPGTRLITIEEGRKPAFLAGLTLSASLVAPILAASTECLMAAGLAPAEASALAVKGLDRARRAFTKAGRKGWHGDLAAKEPADLARQWQAAESLDPLLGEMFGLSAGAAAQWMRGDSGWTAAFNRLRRPRNQH
jgi:hypothetical protein